MEEEEDDEKVYYSDEFRQKAKELHLEPVQFEFVQLACEAFKSRNKCNKDCLYLNHNLCPHKMKF